MQINTQPLTLARKEPIEALRIRHGYIAAAYSFAQIYLWRNEMQLQICLQEDLYAVRGTRYGDNAWLWPVGGEAEQCAFLQARLAEPGLQISCMREQDAEFLQKHFPGAFSVEPAEEESEYLYDRAEQLALEGKRFAGIRNHIRRAERDHALSTEPLCDENILAAIEIAEDWQRLNHEQQQSGLRDDGLPTEMLQLRKELEISGILVRVDGEPFAVCAGYPLSSEMFDFALAKQKGYLPGLSYYAKYALYQSLPEQYRFVNAEDDLGIEGLRTMKYQMRPAGMINMFRAAAR